MADELLGEFALGGFEANKLARGEYFFVSVEVSELDFAFAAFLLEEGACCC